jgi:hypothetical protein
LTDVPASLGAARLADRTRRMRDRTHSK